MQPNKYLAMTNLFFLLNPYLILINFIAGKVVSLTKETNIITETWFIVGGIVLLGIAVWVMVCLTAAWFYKAKKGKCKKQAACTEDDDRLLT